MGMLELLDCILLPCPSLVPIPMLVVVSDISYAEGNHSDMRLTSREIRDEFAIDQDVLIVVARVIVIHICTLHQYNHPNFTTRKTSNSQLIVTSSPTVATTCCPPCCPAATKVLD